MNFLQQEVFTYTRVSLEFISWFSKDQRIYYNNHGFGFFLEIVKICYLLKIESIYLLCSKLNFLIKWDADNY